MARSVEIARAFITLEAETKGLDQQLSQAERSLGRTAKFIQDNPIAAMTALGTAAIAAAFELAKMAEETNKALGIIADRVPGATGHIAELRAEVNRLAVDFAISQDKVIATMDAASRAGVKNGEDLVQVTSAAIAAGRAIGEDGQNLIGGLSAILKIFGIDASSATAAMVTFMAAAKGRTDVDALLDTVTKLAPAVAGTGLSFTTTLSAVTALLNEGFAPGKKLIAEFNKELKEGGVPAIEALAAKAPLAGDAVQQFTDAIKRNTESIEGENAKAMASLHAQLVELGTVLEPLAASAAGAIAGILKFFKGVDAASIAATAGAIAADKAASAAAVSANTGAAAFKALGVSGGVAAGGAGALAGTLFEIKNASSELGHASVADLTRYKTVLEAAVASGKLDAEDKKLLTKVTDELAKKRKEEADAATKAARDILEARKTLLDLEKKYSDATITLAEGQAQALEAIEVVFGEAILKLKGDQKDKALALQAETIARTKAAWVAVGKVITEDIAPKIEVSQSLMVDSLAKLSTSHTDLNVQVGKTSERYGKLNLDYDDAIAKQKAHGVAMHETFKEVTGLVDGFNAFTKAIGLSDPALDQVLKGVGDITNAIGQIASGKIGEGLLSGISGLSGVIAGLFGGESESARKVRVALQATQDELERHRKTLGDLIALSQPGAQVVNLTGGINEILDAFKEMQAKGGVASVLTGIDTAHVAPILAKRGLSIDDLEKLAKDLGIDLHLGQNADFFSIQQLNTLLQDIDARDSGFAKTFEGQMDLLTRRWNIIGADAKTKLNDLVGLASGPQGSPALAGLKNFNLTTDTGQAGALNFLASVLARGDLTSKDLGGLNLTQFRDLLGQIADLIRGVAPDTTLGETPSLPPKVGDPNAQNPNPQPQPGAGDGGALPVDPVADPVFTPNLEAANWEELLGLERQVPDLLTQILGKMDLSPIQAPPLPAGVLGSIAATGGAALSVSGPLVGTVNLFLPDGADQEAMVDLLLKAMKDRRVAEAMDASAALRYKAAIAARGLGTL